MVAAQTAMITQKNWERSKAAVFIQERKYPNGHEIEIVLSEWPKRKQTRQTTRRLLAAMRVERCSGESPEPRHLPHPQQYTTDNAQPPRCREHRVVFTLVVA